MVTETFNPNRKDRPMENNWTFQVDSILAVVGNDPEAGDMENPTGVIAAATYFVVAIDKYGRVFAHHHGTPDPAQADRWCDSIRRRATQEFDAKTSTWWAYIRDQYGSRAFEDNQMEDAYRERDDALTAEAIL